MKKLFALVSTVTVLSSVVAMAMPSSTTTKKPAKPPKTAAKVTDLWVCPMTDEAVEKGKEAGTPVVVGNRRVHFCCAGCPDTFAKLTDAQKKEKVASAVKKEAETTKKQ